MGSKCVSSVCGGCCCFFDAIGQVACQSILLVWVVLGLVCVGYGRGGLESILHVLVGLGLVCVCYRTDGLASILHVLVGLGLVCVCYRTDGLAIYIKRVGGAWMGLGGL